jgi:ATP-dependent exoDNAse (exonuclease V) beta subunit
VALLFRVKKYAAWFEAALAEAGYPCHTMKGQSFSDFPEIRGLVASSLFMAGQALDFNLYSLLSSPLGSISDQALETLTWSGVKFWPLNLYFTEARLPFPANLPLEELQSLTQIRELLLALKPLSLRRPPGEILETILEARDLLPLIVGQPDGLERVKLAQNFLGLVKALPYHDPSVGLGSAEQIQELWISETAQREVSPSDESCSKEDLAPSAINIMTVHQAKGLEFPVTIIPEADRTKRSAKKSLLIDDSGGLGLSYKNLDSLEEENLPFQDILRAEEEADLLEHKRLLYVAATRARDHLVFIGKIPSESNSSWVSYLNVSVFNNKAKDQVKTKDQDKVKANAKGQDKVKVKAKDQAKDQDKDKIQVKIISDWGASVNSLDAGQASTRSQTAPRPTTLESWDLDERLVGSLEKDPTMFISVVDYCALLAQQDEGYVGQELAEGVANYWEDEAFGPEGPTSARSRGIIFHALLEETDYDWDAAKYLELIQTLAKRLQLKPSSAEASFLAERALDFQTSSFGQEAQQALASGRTLWREKGFWLKLDNVCLERDDYQHVKTVILNGVMDLFYVRSDGRGQVVDYKFARRGHLDVYQKQVDFYKRATREAGFTAEVAGDLWFAGS